MPGQNKYAIGVHIYWIVLDITEGNGVLGMLRLLRLESQ